MTKTPKKQTRKALIKKLDEVFSKYIRHKYATHGKLQCYTCDKEGEIKEMQNGHFWSRKHFTTRWDEDNCRPQCVGCNVFKSGNHPAYGMKMLREYGQDKLERLEQKKNELHKVSLEWYHEQIEYYKNKVKNYENK